MCDAIHNSKKLFVSSKELRLTKLKLEPFCIYCPLLSIHFTVGVWFSRCHKF